MYRTVRTAICYVAKFGPGVKMFKPRHGMSWLAAISMADANQPRAVTGTVDGGPACVAGTPQNINSVRTACQLSGVGQRGKHA